MIERAGMNVMLSVKGIKYLEKKLHRLKDPTQRKIVRRALSMALTPISRAAKAKCPVSEEPPLIPGLLKKSIGKKLKTYPRWGKVWGGVGPRTGFKIALPPGPDGKARFQNPTRYAHFSEFGTINEPARPWLRPALDENRAKATAILAREIGVGIQKEAAKK